MRNFVCLYVRACPLESKMNRVLIDAAADGVCQQAFALLT